MNYYERSVVGLPFPASIGWIRLVQTDHKTWQVEKMSYEDTDVDTSPDVIINATSVQTGIVIKQTDERQYVIKIKNNTYSNDCPSLRRAIDMVKTISVLDWIALNI